MPASLTFFGVISQDGVPLRVQVHLHPAVDGSFAGTLDNIDVGCTGFVLSSIVYDGAVLRFAAPGLEAEFSGRMARDGSRAEGTWWMEGTAAPLTLYRVTPSPIDGIWAGELTAPNVRLRLVFYLGTGRDSLIGAMKSVDQGEAMVALSAVRCVGSTVVFEASQIGARYEASLDDAAGMMSGDWMQGGAHLSLKLNLVASEDEVAPVRPQVPQPPFPYRVEDVRYPNPRGGHILAGTLTIPEGAGPFPAVLLISGSGQHDRDGAMSGHRPFLVLADHLTHRGIAVLRTDDRGVGESGGDFHQATTSDFATDAESAVAFLRTRPELDAARIGLIGHSEGGLIAAMVAARDPRLALIVLMAAAGVPPWQLARDQARRAAELSGGDGAAAADFNGDIAAIIRHEPDPDALRRKLLDRLKDLPAAQRDASLAIAMHPWQRHYLSLDPADFYRRVQCPALAVNGSRDAVVDAAANLAAIRASNTRIETMELPGLNHLFQTCETGSSTEYGQIEETLAPSFLDAVESWLRRRFEPYFTFHS
jgi:uncharacterized protein